MEGDDVHVPLAQNELVFSRVLGKIQGEDLIGLMVEQCVGGVDVFGFCVIHDPSAKSNDIAADVDDGDHDPVSEVVIVVGPAVFLALADKTRLQEFLV